MLSRGKAYMQQGMIEKALVDFERVLKLDPDNVNAALTKASCLNLKVSTVFSKKERIILVFILGRLYECYQLIWRCSWKRFWKEFFYKLIYDE